MPPSDGVLSLAIRRTLTVLSAAAVVCAANLAVAADEAATPASTLAADQAQPDPAAPDPEAWRLSWTGYGWLMSVAGNVTTRGQTVDVNASFIDLLQKSDSMTAFMSYFEANKGPAGLYADLVWTKLGFARSMASYRNPLPGLQLSVTANAALVTEMTIAEIGGLYELHRWPGSAGSFTAVDALAGFRYWNMSASASVDALATATYTPLGIGASRQFGVSLSNTTQWVDPLIGLRLRHRFTPHQDILVRGDIGGFGLGSQITWQALAVYSYEWKVDGLGLAAVLGYRALGANYGTGSGFDAAGMNLVLHGPVVGLTFRF
ncbi:MAG: hypothetical protein Q8M19_00670 [Reyranella sp.]|nr:hypothetical protein [Reyranella sp.]